MSSRAEVRDGILAWLESERIRFASLAAAAGVPPSVAVRGTLAVDVTEASATYHEYVRMLSPLGAPLDEVPRSFWVAGLSNEPVPPSILFEYYGERCNVWMVGSGQPTAEMKARALLARTRMDYLSQLETLRRGDRPSAERSVE